MKKTLYLIFFICFPAVAAQAKPCDCPENLAFVIEKVESNYAGFQDKINPTHDASYARRKAKMMRKAKKAVRPQQCAELISSWLQTFQDGHLYLSSKGAGMRQSPVKGEAGLPVMHRLDTVRTLLVLPSFDLRFAGTIDSLVASFVLHPTTHLLIDIRGNRGGGDRAYAALLPLLYTRPYEVHGVEFLASPDNRANFEALLQEDIPAATRSVVEELVVKLKASPGQFVSWGERRSHVTYETVMPLPVRVAVIQDDRCASAAEQFLLYALQSEKVVTYGISNSKGALDYANVNEIPLPSMPYTVCIASSRSTRLPEVSVDRHGIAPQVLIPKGTKDVVGFAREHLLRQINME